MSMSMTVTSAVTVVVPAPVMRTVAGIRGSHTGGISAVASTLWAWCPRGTCPSALLAFADSVLEVSGGFSENRMMNE